MIRFDGYKNPFCFPPLPRGIGSSWNPVRIKRKDPFCLLRYHLSRSVQRMKLPGDNCKTDYRNIILEVSRKILNNTYVVAKNDFIVIEKDLFVTRLKIFRVLCKMMIIAQMSETTSRHCKHTCVM